MFKEIARLRTRLTRQEGQLREADAEQVCFMLLFFFFSFLVVCFFLNSGTDKEFPIIIFLGSFEVCRNSFTGDC